MKFLSKATIPSSGKKVSECPYAVALEETTSVTSHEDTTNNNNNTTTHHLIEESIKQCPAFAASSNADSTTTCPFQGKTSQDDIKATFLQIPPSHYQMKAFTAVLAKLHDHTGDAAEAKNSHFHIPGGCPVPAEIKHQMSFRQAMEDLSLAAIMGRLAESMEEGTPTDAKNSINTTTPG
mmetsp:Transcript_14704/g.27927  ORF Transcript_14704/g.27927 Transcript_14704/m.27927 type:complete len:179 (-) Transcript_14704:6-542(-)